MSIKKFSEKVLISATKRMLSSSANSTSCIVAYQPTAPAALKKFSKIENDK